MDCEADEKEWVAKMREVKQKHYSFGDSMVESRKNVELHKVGICVMGGELKFARSNLK